jgi:DnaJ-class molecular chaperone
VGLLCLLRCTGIRPPQTRSIAKVPRSSFYMYKDYYRILEVNDNASAGEIHDAYVNALARIGSMKIRQSNGEYQYLDLEALLREINEANKVLSNPITKEIYDTTTYIKPNNPITRASQPTSPHKFSILNFIHKEIGSVFGFVVGFIWFSWATTYITKQDEGEISYPFIMISIAAALGLMFWFGKNLYENYKRQKDYKVD